MNFLIDSNVILDIATEDPHWFDWSSSTLSRCMDRGKLSINPIIYAEISIGFSRIEELEKLLPPSLFSRLPLPWEAAFLAGKSFLHYKKSSGSKSSPLPDFYIGAHAAIAKMALVTRDHRRFQSYFPKLQLIYPE